MCLHKRQGTVLGGQGDGSLGSPILGAKTTTYTYTALGKVESVVDSLNNRQEFTYDSMGRNTVVRDALNNTSTAEYDKLGNVTKLAGPLGGATNYSYDEMGRLISESTASGGTITYGYNALNVKEQLTNARGQVRKFFYDAMGRITGFVGAEDSVSYTYDDNGNVLTVSDKNGVIKREYDALNRIIKLTDTFGKSIQYTYDAVGNLASIIYPDNTAVNYSYDANNNLVSVTDWANRVTSYTYDVNNMVVGVTKPDGSVTTTVYDNAQRIVSTVEKTASNVVITGFEYTYDNLSRIIEEKHLADNTKMCYTYDNLSRVTNRTIKNECDCVISSENFTYDAAGNITDAPNSCFAYDTNNRLITFNGNTVSYDMDGNMLSNGYINCEFDSGNRLLKAGINEYVYNAEDVRIKNLCQGDVTTYTYNTNCKLSQLLCKTTNGITTKYVYGLGLIGEEKCGEFKTYHFDFRGSTVAITDECGNITDTFKYDTYGKLISRTGNSFVILGYNGRDGVVTDRNGLLYMRARYYSPDMRRFINADILHGEISNAVTLNRYAYANGNPVSNTDPFGLAAEERGGSVSSYGISPLDIPQILADAANGTELIIGNVKFIKDGKYINIKGDSATLQKFGIKQRRIKASNLDEFTEIADLINPKLFDAPGVILDVISIGAETYYEVVQYESAEDRWIVGGYTATTGAISSVASTAAGVGATALATKIGTAIGTGIAPGVGTLIGLGAGLLVGWGMDALFDWIQDEYIDDIVENN